MNPLYAAIVAAVVGKQRRCGKCGKRQAIGRKSKDGRYHCKFCVHAFSKKDLKRSKDG